ncbi:MAG: excinuclease ABC subunit UvrA [Tannerellaceae bacterium]|jgi:excinuclease ABC subunit A|nr:excinuclease ABC subunit UvrA [Tannerellaceae bacterium]
MKKDCIIIKGARVNNLKNVDVEIPRNKLVVITGLSGSGKSSLAFDTLYAEGQRRYVESLSAYARQFLGRMSKPECDYIKGIPPAIAIEQRVNSRNTRSTVGTSTEIYDYLRLLFARAGKTISPVSGEEVRKHQITDIVKWLGTFPLGVRFAVFAPIVLPEGRDVKDQMGILLKEGYSRISVDNVVYRIEEVADNVGLMNVGSLVELLIDRLETSEDKALVSRLADSVETAFFEGHGECVVRVYMPNEEVVVKSFTKRFEADGITFDEPSEYMFSFNNPMGACPDCEGFGRAVGLDAALIVPDGRLSVYNGAVAPWRSEVFSEWLKDFIIKSSKGTFPIHRPYDELTAEEKDYLWNGTKDVKGINDFFKFVESNIYKIQYRVIASRYKGKTLCPTCRGSRLKPQALYVKVGGKDIAQLVSLPVVELKSFFDNLVLDETDMAIAKRILTEIRSRIQFLLDVGLGYLTLDRLSSTLSGGESQRINLATSLGSSLVGSLYILDEPSIGLHSRDTQRLIHVLRQLKELGNTVVIVEHDEEIIRAADYIIDIGPKAGRLGGEVVYEGGTANLQLNTNSHTLRFLNGEESIELPAYRRRWNNFIEVAGAKHNNLKDITVRFPLNAITVVTGVSGSGKSSLVRDVLFESLSKQSVIIAPLPVHCSAVTGDWRLVREVCFVDQNTIGKSSRSNPVTYIGAYDEIRKLFAELPMARKTGLTPADFSFNKEGGRCEECKGEGRITVEMQFMADLTMECDVCHGKRFTSHVLDVEYRGVNIYDVLEMTIDQAIEFFNTNNYQDRRVLRRIEPLQHVGLGYIKMGQPSSTLSGGENQRVKLAYYLALERYNSTLFIFDEPTTGLHFYDIKTLMTAFNALVDKGHTVIIIEHNIEIIKCADHVIDLGPEGGKDGGNIVCAGTPEDVARCAESHTGRALAPKLQL